MTNCILLSKDHLTVTNKCKAYILYLWLWFFISIAGQGFVYGYFLDPHESLIAWFIVNLSTSTLTNLVLLFFSRLPFCSLCFVDDIRTLQFLRISRTSFGLLAFLDIFLAIFILFSGNSFWPKAFWTVFQTFFNWPIGLIESNSGAIKQETKSLRHKKSDVFCKHFLDSFHSLLCLWSYYYIVFVVLGFQVWPCIRLLFTAEAPFFTCWEAKFEWFIVSLMIG